MEINFVSVFFIIIAQSYTVHLLKSEKKILLNVKSDRNEQEI